MPFFERASSIDASGSSFTEVGRDQIHNITNVTHYRRDSVSPLKILEQYNVANAAYDSVEKSSACLPETRKTLLKRLYRTLSNPNGRHICWLSGLPGSGKSSVAQSIAEMCCTNKVLAASFFFSRDAVDRSTTKLFVTSIAYQLTILQPHLRSAIEKILQANSMLPDKQLKFQLRELIINPLRSVRSRSSKPMVVVVDGLDGCTDEDLARELISLLAETLSKFKVPLKFFITSRPEPHIEAEFSDPTIAVLTRPFVLEDYHARSDIRIFLRARFDDICRKRREVMDLVSKPWPTDDDLDTLVEQSSGLFIFASAVMKFIGDPAEHPARQLTLALDRKNNPNTSVYSSLDHLYKRVLTPLFDDHRFRIALGTIILLFDPLSLRALDELQQLESGSTRLSLQPLHSLVLVPDDDDRTLRTIHPSLRDFLTDNNRSDSYYIDSQEHHGDIAQLSFNLMMKVLRKDMCELGEPSKSKLMYTPDQCKMPFSAALQYACRHWPMHMVKSSKDSTKLTEILTRFCTGYLLVWIEALSLLDILDTAVPSLRAVRMWLNALQSPHTGCIQMLYDMEQFVIDFFSLIRFYPLHIYHTALPFLPRGISLREDFELEAIKYQKSLSSSDGPWDQYITDQTWSRDGVTWTRRDVILSRPDDERFMLITQITWTCGPDSWTKFYAKGMKGGNVWERWDVIIPYNMIHGWSLAVLDGNAFNEVCGDILLESIQELDWDLSKARDMTEEFSIRALAFNDCDTDVNNIRRYRCKGRADIKSTLSIHLEGDIPSATVEWSWTTREGSWELYLSVMTAESPGFVSARTLTPSNQSRARPTTQSSTNLGRSEMTQTVTTANETTMRVENTIGSGVDKVLECVTLSCVKSPPLIDLDDDFGDFLSEADTPSTSTTSRLGRRRSFDSSSTNFGTSRSNSLSRPQS